MLNYLEAGDVRRKYPEQLSRSDIDAIISEWNDAGIERVDMLVFSSMFDPSTHKLNISEMELVLRGQSHFHFKELEPIGSRKFYGMLAVMHFENLTGYRDAYEVEKKTYDLRLVIGREFLDKCKDSDAKELSDAFKSMIGIRAEAAKKYQITQHRWQNQLDKLIKEYLLNE